MVWPGMGSEVPSISLFSFSLRAHDLDSTQIVFELYSKQNQPHYYIHVLWGGKPMKASTPMEVLDYGYGAAEYVFCLCVLSFSLLPAENDERWVDVDEMVGMGSDLYMGCNAP